MDKIERTTLGPMTGLECLTKLEQDWSLEAIAARLRTEQKASKLEPFPDPVGEDRDQRRVIEWDFTR